MASWLLNYSAAFLQVSWLLNYPAVFLQVSWFPAPNLISVIKLPVSKSDRTAHD
jgi:hypothetical protein